MMNNGERKEKQSVHIFEMAVFAMLGSIMFVSKILMEALPNIHLLGMLTMLYTVVYRKKALIPIYIYILLNGIYAGFSLWWIPYLYLWAILWGVTMLLPRNLSKKKASIVYPVVCALHGLAFGSLYAPAQAIMFNLDFRGMITWIIAGLPYDAIHCAGNFVAGFLIVPLVEPLKKLKKYGSKITGDRY